MLEAVFSTRHIPQATKSQTFPQSLTYWNADPSRNKRKQRSRNSDSEPQRHIGPNSSSPLQLPQRTQALEANPLKTSKELKAYVKLLVQGLGLIV